MKPDGARLQQTLWYNLAVKGTSGSREDPVVRIHSSRVLFPFLMQVPQALGVAAEHSFSLIRLLSIFLALMISHWFLLHWFDDALAFAGTLFMAATLPLTFTEWFEIPTDFVEIIIFTLGIWAIYRSKFALVCVLTLIGTLSRESTAVLPFFLFFSVFERKSLKWLLPVVSAGLCWLIPLLILRWWVGAFEAHGYGLGIRHNIEGLSQLLMNPHPYNNYLFWIYLFGAFWILPYLRWKAQPGFFKRLLVAIPFVVIVYVVVGGYFNEPRELVNLYPILVPAGLIALFADFHKEHMRHELFDKSASGLDEIVPT